MMKARHRATPPKAMAMQRHWVSFLFITVACLVSVTAGSQSSAAEISVAQMEICLKVEDRQPVGKNDRFPNDVGRLVCWTKIQDGAGTDVVHAWFYDGVTQARIELPVRGHHWRTYSSKQVPPGMTGPWEVKVMTLQGRVLATRAFEVFDAEERP